MAPTFLVILPEHLSQNSRIICDLAVPYDVDPFVSPIYPDLMQIMGGIVRLPEGNEFIVGGIPLPSKEVYQTLELADGFGFQLGLFKEERSY